MGGEPGENFGDRGWHPCFRCGATGYVEAEPEPNGVPTAEDEQWLLSQSHPDAAPPSQSFLESVQRQADHFRRDPDSTSQFLANQLDNICQLIVWTGARNPSDYVERLEIADDGRRATWFDRGYAMGVEDARRESGAYRPE
jgi:hypothetical protein